jgi:hypothetical protein
MKTLRAAALFAATLSTVSMAGVFAIYANAIMPGLWRVDDRTFVAAFQAIDSHPQPVVPRGVPRRPRQHCSGHGRWNLARAVTSTAAFACLACAGRTRPRRVGRARRRGTAPRTRRCVAGRWLGTTAEPRPTGYEP